MLLEKPRSMKWRVSGGIRQVLQGDRPLKMIFDIFLHALDSN